MTWVIPALLAPFVWAISNLIDSRLIREKIISPITITAIVGLLGAIPAVILSGSSIIEEIDRSALAVGVLAGVIALFSFYPYYRALETEHPASAVLMWNAAPFAIAILARVFLDERLWLNGWISAGLLVTSSFIMSLPAINHRSSRQAVGWMAIASVMIACEALLQRWLMLRLPVASVITIMYGAGAITALAILVIRANCRVEIAALATRRTGVFVLLNEGFNIIGGLASSYAVAMGPVGLVKAVGGLQPLFVVAFGAILTALSFRKSRADAESPSFAMVALASVLAIAGLALLGTG